MDISIIYPTIGSLLYNIPDSLLMDSICRTYNDWTGEFCGAFPKRLKGIAMLNVDDVGVGVKELERAHKLGFTGAMIPCYPPEDRLYNQPMYDPLWAAARTWVCRWGCTSPATVTRVNSAPWRITGRRSSATPTIGRGCPWPT